MQAKRKYEEEILRRVQSLPEEQLARVISLLDKLAEEEKKKRDSQKAIEELRGKYKDVLSSTEEFMRRKEEEKKLDR